MVNRCHSKKSQAPNLHFPSVRYHDLRGGHTPLTGPPGTLHLPSIRAMVSLLSEPFKLCKVWNFLVLPYLRKFHQGLNIIRLHTWRLSSNLSERQTFRHRLQRQLQLLSGCPKSLCTRGNDLPSTIGVMGEVLLPARPLPSR